MIGLRILARLLCYPDAALIDSIGDIRDTLRHGTGADAHMLAKVEPLLRELGERDLYDLQAAYVGTFDRVRTLSLHLFEHVHGDSRARGPAMLDLIALYRKHGLDPTAHELPDYLPLFLEFLSILPTNEARRLLAEIGHIVVAVQARLARRDSAYAGVFDALATLAGVPLASSGDVDDPDVDSPMAVDRAWEEAAVAFGPDAKPATDADEGACGRAAAIVARMNDRHPLEGRRP